MGLNIVKKNSNMYQGSVTHTWNTVKGKCPHDCSYCYMKRWGELKPVRFDKKELKTDLGSGNYIFVGSSCDMFADDIPNDWIMNTLTKCNWYDNKYLFQTKNPANVINYRNDINREFTICTTIETNRLYPEMGITPHPEIRSIAMKRLTMHGIKTMLTIEPIMDFDAVNFLSLIKFMKPVSVNIGADSGNNNLPEPSWKKIQWLINELQQFTTISKKKNLDRLKR